MLSGANWQAVAGPCLCPSNRSGPQGGLGDEVQPGVVHILRLLLLQMWRAVFASAELLAPANVSVTSLCAICQNKLSDSLHGGSTATAQCVAAPGRQLGPSRVRMDVWGAWLVCGAVCVYSDTRWVEARCVCRDRQGLWVLGVQSIHVLMRHMCVHTWRRGREPSGMARSWGSARLPCAAAMPSVFAVHT